MVGGDAIDATAAMGARLELGVGELALQTLDQGVFRRKLGGKPIALALDVRPLALRFLECAKKLSADRISDAKAFAFGAELKAERLAAA